MDLRELNDKIKAIKEEYKPDKTEAWEQHKLITKALKTELEPLEKELEERKLEILELDLPENDEFRYMKRKDFKVNADELEDEYMMMVPNIDKIRDELRESEWTKPIPGVEVYDKKSVVVKPWSN